MSTRAVALGTVLALAAAAAPAGAAAAGRPASPRVQVMMLDHARAKPCCASFAEIDYEGVHVATRINFDLDKDSPAFEFPTGISYQKGFALPKRAQAFKVRVEAPVRHEGAFGVAPELFMMVPVVTVLDAEHRPTRVLTVEPKLAKQTQHAEIELLPTAAERYLVVHTDPAWFGRGTEIDHGFGIRWWVPFTPEGRARLVLEKRR